MPSQPAFNKDLWYKKIWEHKKALTGPILNCPQISQSSNIQKFPQIEEWNVSQESKSSLLVLYRVWERKALTDSHSKEHFHCWRQAGQTATDLFQWLFIPCVYEGFFC